MTEETAQRLQALEAELKYLILPGMTAEQKLKRLGDAYWQAANSGYGDAMANKLMSGIEDEQTREWEENCRHKYAVAALINLLKAEKEEEPC